MQATHRTHPACLSSQSLPCGHDVRMDGAHSGLLGVAVGGSFLHAASVFFLSKKVITNHYEKFVGVRNAPPERTHG